MDSQQKKYVRNLGIIKVVALTIGIVGLYSAAESYLQGQLRKKYDKGFQEGRQNVIQYEAELIEHQLGIDCGSRKPQEYSFPRILAWYPPRAEEPDKNILKDEDKSTGNLELRILCDGPSTPRYSGSPDYTTLKLSVPLKDLRVEWLESIWDTRVRE